jgi:hypothetical protein
MPGMKKSPRPTPNPRRSDPVSRGNAASRRQQSKQDDVLKNGGRGMKAGGKVKKMKDGGEAQSRAAARADRLRKDLETREGRPARQEAEYQAAQQRRREAGGLSRLAMIPEAVRRAQMRVGDRLLASSQARENAPLRAEVDAADRAMTDTLGRKAGGKVKKMRAGGGNMSSESLRRRISEDSLARGEAIRDTYDDRGTAGQRQKNKEYLREINDWAKDRELIDTYGRDAPNARSFNTRRATGAPSAKRAAGGAVKKMKAGGKCRGMGAATRGGNFSRG